MEVDKSKLEPTHLAILDELKAAIAELSDAFMSGDDSGVSSITGRIRGLESQILEIQRESVKHDLEFHSIADLLEATIKEKKSGK